MDKPLHDKIGFLASNSFYPLLLSTLLAGAFFAFRVFYSGTRNYSNLVWNLFLAWLPYIASTIAYYLFRNNRKNWLYIFGLCVVWLIFFPNAPYLVTDFYHLDPRPPVPLWFDISLLAIFAFTGFFIAIASLRSVHRIVEAYFGRIFGWLFTLIVFNLASLGVYLGRFERYNSWDVLLDPKSLLKDIASNILNPLDNLGFVGFTIMFSSMLLVAYLMFVSASNSHYHFKQQGNQPRPPVENSEDMKIK